MLEAKFGHDPLKSKLKTIEQCMSTLFKSLNG